MPTTDELMDEGNTALAIGELEEAAKYFRQVVEQDPEFQDGWHALSMRTSKRPRPRRRARRRASSRGVERSSRSHWMPIWAGLDRSDL
jgi:hypothetical protein